MPDHVKRLAACGAVLAVPCLLAACASHGQGKAASGPKAEQDVAVVRSSNPLDYRFDMQQQGRKMTADEFDAWMQARGIRIAKGPPAKPAAAVPHKRVR